MDENEKSQLRHDLRGCLNSIALSVEVLRLGGESTEAPEFLRCIAAEVAKMERLVKQLDRRPTLGLARSA